jgi:hypothetical protein
MRKVLVILFVIGFIIGTFSVIEELCEELSSEQMDSLDGDVSENGAGDSVPCGEGGGSGGGGGQPG